MNGFHWTVWVLHMKSLCAIVFLRQLECEFAITRQFEFHLSCIQHGDAINMNQQDNIPVKYALYVLDVVSRLHLAHTFRNL